MGRSGRPRGWAGGSEAERAGKAGPVSPAHARQHAPLSPRQVQRGGGGAFIQRLALSSRLWKERWTDVWESFPARPKKAPLTRARSRGPRPPRQHVPACCWQRPTCWGLPGEVPCPPAPTGCWAGAPGDPGTLHVRTRPWSCLLRPLPARALRTRPGPLVKADRKPCGGGGVLGAPAAPPRQDQSLSGLRGGGVWDSSAPRGRRCLPGRGTECQLWGGGSTAPQPRPG